MDCLIAAARRAGLCAILMFLFWSQAQALPSFARQTGLACAECHTVFPQLTPLGREFKLRGYLLSEAAQGNVAFPMDQYPPVSVMLQADYTSTSKKQPGTQNGDVEFPDQLSLFYAGRISGKLGAFLQTTYSGPDDEFSMDNADVRFADVAANTDLLYGFTLNNNPTVQDAWSSTPAWGYPFASSNVAPEPIAGTQIDGALGQQVAGLGAYALWNEKLYGELSFYRDAQIGGTQPPDGSRENTVEGNAPYARIALQNRWGSNALEVGALAFCTHIFPTGVTGKTNYFRDIGVDAQYQHLTDNHTLTAHALWIQEKQDRDADFAAGDSARSSLDLSTFKADATYYFHRKYGGSLAYFSTTGDRDRLLYAPEAVTGSRTGKPDTRGWIGELDYVPWPNTKLALQYTAYDRFNGSSSNYDGSGRDASDNDTLFLLGWIAY
jgi:hypothetical protein